MPAVTMDDFLPVDPIPLKLLYPVSFTFEDRRPHPQTVQLVAVDTLEAFGLIEVSDGSEDSDARHIVTLEDLSESAVDWNHMERGAYWFRDPDLRIEQAESLYAYCIDTRKRLLEEVAELKKKAAHLEAEARQYDVYNRASVLGGKASHEAGISGSLKDYRFHGQQIPLERLTYIKEGWGGRVYIITRITKGFVYGLATDQHYGPALRETSISRGSAIAPWGWPSWFDETKTTTQRAPWADEYLPKTKLP